MAAKDEKPLDLRLWFREFKRGDLQAHKLAPDVDTLATEQQQKDLFVDHFGTLLKDSESFRKRNTYDKLCSLFWNDEHTILQTYCVADGQEIPKYEQKPWFRSELRFLSIVIPTDEAHQKGSVAPISSVAWAPWFFFIASSAAIHSEQDILHIMSWSRDDGQFRFYARDDIMNQEKPAKGGWVYLCSSEDAFDANEKHGKAYLGPLNGHVNGGLVMKEIHKPWLHWLVGGRGVSELLDDNLTKSLGAARWLTAEGYPPLYGASVQSAEVLEKIIIDSLRTWFESRRSKDFMNYDPTSKKYTTTKKNPSNIQRWAAHFFLTTTVNIAAVPSSNLIIPSDFFFNYEMLRGYSDLLPNSRQQTKNWQDTHPYWGDSLKKWNERNKPVYPDGVLPWSVEDWYGNYSIPQFSYDNGTYLWAARELKLCTLQEVSPNTPGSIPFKQLAGGVFMGTLEDGKEKIDGEEATAFAVTQWGEGDNPWIILQGSLEDAMGVWTAQKLFLGSDYQQSRCRLFSDKTFNALMMVDFCNPIYSWRRLRLMQYIPVETTLTGPEMDKTIGEEVYTYDLEERFISNIKAAVDKGGLDDHSPEHQFLKNLEEPILALQIRVFDYTTNVSNNLGSSEYVLKYMKLAESRRRMFRPLPMNFFGSNLPYCLAMDPDTPWLEMTEKGDVQRIPEIGAKFLRDWLGNLAGSNPQIIPQEEKRTARLEDGKPRCTRGGIPRPSTMRMQCQASVAMSNPQRVRSGCPYARKPVLWETMQSPILTTE